MANDFYNRNSSFNPDELADGDAIEAEFDAIGRGFDTIEDLVNANKSGYPTQTFHVAPAELDTHAVPKAQMETALSFKLDDVNYNPTDILSKLKTVDGTDSGLDADYLDGQHGSYYRNADNINAGTLAKERLPSLSEIGAAASADLNPLIPAASASFVYTGSTLTQMTEQLIGGERVTSFAYTDGRLTSAVEVLGSVTKTTTFNYQNGTLTGFTTTEVVA